MSEGCPFCAIAAGGEAPHTTQEDVVHRDEATTAFVSARWWPGNEGHAIVVPNRHARDLYEIPDDDLAAVHRTVKRVAAAIRASYGCDGTSTRQHNDAGQDVLHFHVHVFPRRLDDRLYERNGEMRWTTPEERAPYVARLRDALATAWRLPPATARAAGRPRRGS